tara:strand:+ start:746 stop:1720 length:975 start_codon:yes stop_codon:yes gene_type:complete
MDINTDVTQHLLREVLQEYPELAKHAQLAISGPEVRDSLPLSSFADPHNRYYPVHTPEHAILSKAYTTKVANVAPHVVSRIDDALDLFGLDLPESRTVKEASNYEPPYLIPSQSKFPLRDASDIPYAEAALLRNRSKLQVKTAASAAITLVKYAADAGINVSSEILTMAGITQCDTEKASMWIEARSDAASEPEHSEAYIKVSEFVKNLGSTASRADLTKLAAAVEELDIMSGLSKHYGRNLPDPMATVFNTKVAMQPSMDLGGTMVPVSKLVGMGPEVIGDILGDDIVPEISSDGEVDPQKLMEILETLPKDMKELLASKVGM